MNEKYLAAVETIKAAILKSQSRTVQNTNRESLLLYYSIGEYVSSNSREGTWGTSAIDEISARLREELPGLRGFSSRNIKSMRQFYEAWQPYLQFSQPLELSEKSATAATDLALTAEAVLALSENRPPVATDFRMEDFTGISFTHHMEILHTVKGVAERLFYIQASARCHWSKYTLREKIKAGLVSSSGSFTQ